MLYLGSFNKNYFSVGNNPFFYQEGKSYPDDCNIKVPCFIIFDNYSSTHNVNYSNIVNYHSILYYAPFLNNYVLANLYYRGDSYKTLYPYLESTKNGDNYSNLEKINPYLYNVNGKSIALPNLFFCKTLNIYNTTINNCYYSSLMLDDSYTYVPYSFFPEYDYDLLEKYEHSYKSSSVPGGFYIDDMKFDFSSSIVAKHINTYGVHYGDNVLLYWNFCGYVRSGNAIDLTQENNLIEDKVAGKYNFISFKYGNIVTNSLPSVYLGLSLYQMSFDDTTLYLYFSTDVGSFVYNVKTINRTDNSIENYIEVGKDIKNKVSIGYVERYERNSGNNFIKVSEWAAINVEDTLQIGGYWKSDYTFSNNRYRIDEETVVTFTYVKNEDSAKNYSDIDLKYSGSTLDCSFLSKKPACFTMELQRLGD